MFNLFFVVVIKKYLIVLFSDFFINNMHMSNIKLVLFSHFILLDIKEYNCIFLQLNFLLFSLNV